MKGEASTVEQTVRVNQWLQKASENSFCCRNSFKCFMENISYIDDLIMTKKNAFYEQLLFTETSEKTTTASLSWTIFC